MIEAFDTRPPLRAAFDSRARPAHDERIAPTEGFAVALEAAARRGDRFGPDVGQNDDLKRVAETMPGAATEQPDRADVFNARGFFADDVPYARGEERATVCPIAPPALASKADDRAMARPAGERAVELSFHARSQRIGSADARSMDPAPLGRAARATASAAGSVPNAPASSRIFAAATLPVIERGPRPTVPRASQSPLAITVQDVANGVQVVARIDGLDEQESAELRDEIAALVTTHGRTAIDIAIVGRTTPRGPRQGHS